MIWISIAAAVAIVFVALIPVKHAARGFTIFSLSCVSIGFLAAGCIATVPPGHVGVQVLWGAVNQTSLPEGLNIVNPFIRVYHMSARTQTYTMADSPRSPGERQHGRAVIALSSDGLRIPMEVSIVYRLAGKDAAWVLQNIGYNYQAIILRPAGRSAIREAASNYTAQEAYATKRDELARAMRDLIRKEVAGIVEERGFKGRGIIIQEVLLRNVDLPTRVKNAIEEKLSAEQEAQRMTFVLERERKEAQRKEIEAKGIQKFQEIVRQGIDEKLLKWKGIEATLEIAKSQNAKVIIVGGADGLPIILNTESKK